MLNVFRTAVVGFSLLFVCAVASCRFRVRVGSDKKERVQHMLDSVRQAADDLMAGFETGTSAEELRRLSNGTTADSLVKSLRDSCDFAGRFGGYSGHVIRRDRSFGTVDILLYDYSLRCGKRSFLIAYRLRPEIRLSAFEMLQPDADNPLVREIRESTSAGSR